jgi:hypothetical protein
MAFCGRFSNPHSTITAQLCALRAVQVVEYLLVLVVVLRAAHCWRCWAAGLSWAAGIVAASGPLLSPIFPPPPTKSVPFLRPPPIAFPSIRISSFSLLHLPPLLSLSLKAHCPSSSPSIQALFFLSLAAFATESRLCLRAYLLIFVILSLLRLWDRNPLAYQPRRTTPSRNNDSFTLRRLFFGPAPLLHLTHSYSCALATLPT